MSTLDEPFLLVRPRLFGIAHRILKSPADAEDVVQDAWLRWDRAERTAVRDATAFLATATTRLAINVSQSARVRHETPAGPSLPEPADPGADPTVDAERGEAVGEAVHVLLETLSPTERAVLVLREAFDYSYRQVGEVLSLSEPNARQLAARARGRLGGERRAPVDAARHRRLLDAVRAAAQDGKLAALEALLVADIAA